MKLANPSVVLATAMVFFLILPGISAVALEITSSPPFQWRKVDGRLLEKLTDPDSPDTVEFLLRLSDEADIMDVKFQRSDVVHRLKTTASTSQAFLRPQLESQGFTVKRDFWIVNYLLVEGPADRVGELTQLPQVSHIIDNFEVYLVDGDPVATPVEPQAVLTWGLEKVEASRVWDELGIRGQGVRVCVSDTGVDITHPDLDGKMWSDVPGDPEFPGGWIEYDGSGNPVSGSTPHDTQGHGTHTSGTVLGGEASGVAIGMAPEATLMHALTLPGGSGSFAQVVAGIEWCVDPTDDGGNPAGQPADVHSMSWGATGYYDEEIEPILNSYLAGTLPVAATGNEGEGSSRSPGNIYDALGIGASDVDDNIASFSSGEVVQASYWSAPPAHWPDEWTVPLISAPGVSVYSSLPGGGYDYWSGTSMATPHVAGCAALMASANQGLSSDDLLDTLVSTSLWFSTYYPSPPDTRYGWGRIECFDAVELVAYNSGVRGTVRDQEDGSPVDQSRVNVTGSSLQRSMESDATGFFKLSLKPGTYNLTVARFGYNPESFVDITVVEDQWVDLDVLLDPLPHGNITGQAFNNASGIPIPGVSVSIQGIPVTLSAQTDGGGAYAISKVPEGSYTLLATSPYFKALGVGGVNVISGSDTPVGFPMEPREWVAVIGDEGDSISQLLRANGYYVENPSWWEVANDACRYGTVVVNHEYVDGTTLGNFLTATDTAGTGVIFLDTWEHTFRWGGVYNLWYWRSDPGERYYGDDSSLTYLYYNVTQSHPVLSGYNPGDVIIFENSTLWHDYAWFDSYTGENASIIAYAGSNADGDWGPGIAVDNRMNNVHVLMSLHGASSYVKPRDWTPEATQIFLNAVEWAEGPGCANGVMVDYDIGVNPPEGLWYDTFEVSIQAVNVGTVTGDYTAQMYMDGWLQEERTVTLASGEVTTVTFDVIRDSVGTYRVTIGPHQTSFRVRAPIVTVEAQDMSGAALPGAAITVGLGTSVLQMGETDANGTLSFDSPTGSHGQYWIVLQSTEADTGGLHYFLAENRYIEDDSLTSFQPTAATTANLDVVMDTAVAWQAGVVHLRRTDMPAEFASAYAFGEGSIMVDPAAYRLWALTTVQSLQSTWTYETTPTTVNLTSTPSASFQFGGGLEAGATWTQVSTTAAVDWHIRDGYGNELVDVVQRNVGVLDAGETISHQPFLTLWNDQGDMLAAGFVDWSQKPANVNLPENETLAHVQVDLDTGAYPMENVFHLEVEVRDAQGTPLPDVAATGDTSVEVLGSVLLAGQPVFVNLTVNRAPTSIDDNGSFSVTVNLTKGLNTIVISAADLAGNVRERTFVIHSKPDITLRVTSLPALTNVSSVVLEGVVELGANLTLNGIEVQPEEDGFFQVTLELDEGHNSIVVAAVDYLGNRKEIVQDVVLDTIPPEILIHAPSSGETTFDQNVTIVGRTEDEAILRIDGELVTLDEGTFVYLTSLTNGENTFRFEARDPAGNVRLTSMTIYREATILDTPASDYLVYLLYAIPLAAGAAITGMYIWMRRRLRSAQEVNPEPAEESAEDGE